MRKALVVLFAMFFGLSFAVVTKAQTQKVSRSAKKAKKSKVAKRTAVSDRVSMKNDSPARNYARELMDAQVRHDKLLDEQRDLKTKYSIAVTELRAARLEYENLKRNSVPIGIVWSVVAFVSLISVLVTRFFCKKFWLREEDRENLQAHNSSLYGGLSPGGEGGIAQFVPKKDGQTVPPGEYNSEHAHAWEGRQPGNPET